MATWKISLPGRSPVVMEPSLDRLLIIEERPGLAMFSDVLARCAQLVRSAPSAATACRMLRLVRPDLVVIDMAMPGAFEVLRQLQTIDIASAASPPPLVLAVCATGSAEESFRLAQLGVRSSLARPLTADKLEAALDCTLLRPSNFVSYAA
jgi:DNA-binding response OmpR family regulator